MLQSMMHLTLFTTSVSKHVILHSSLVNERSRGTGWRQMVANRESFHGTVLVATITTKTVDRAALREWCEVQWSVPPPPSRFDR